MVLNTIFNQDALAGIKMLDTNSIDCIITSPPYWQLRDYGHDHQIGLEETVNEYILKLRDVFSECKRVLKPEGTLWIVIGDTFAGDKNGITDRKRVDYLGESKIKKRAGSYPRKSLLMIPSRLAISMIDDGWILRNEIIWQKPNVMPQSMNDRFTIDFEKVLFFTKSRFYYFNQPKEPMQTIDLNSPRGSKGSLKQLNKGLRILGVYNKTISAKKANLKEIPDSSSFKERYRSSTNLMRNKRTVWKIATESNSIEHFAMFPKELVETMLEAGCPQQGIVLDPFMGSGTTAVVAKMQNRNFIGFEINPQYVKIATNRVNKIIYQHSIFE